MDRNQPVIFGRRDNGGCLQHIAVLIEIRRRDSIIFSDWSKNVAYFLYARASVRSVENTNKDTWITPVNDSLKSPVPFHSPEWLNTFSPTDRQITVVGEHVEILVSVLVGIDKLDTQVSGLDHLVMEGQVDIARNCEARPRSTP